MNTPTTNTARVVDISIPCRGVVVLQLGSGATIRATTAVVEQLVQRPITARYVTYNSDAAGNRYNARVATSEESPTLRDAMDARDYVRPLGAADVTKGRAD